MEEEAVDEGSQGHVRGRHIKKRSLKNKTLSVSFDEKDLTYVLLLSEFICIYPKMV